MHPPVQGAADILGGRVVFHVHDVPGHTTPAPVLRHYRGRMQLTTQHLRYICRLHRSDRAGLCDSVAYTIIETMSEWAERLGPGGSVVSLELSTYMQRAFNVDELEALDHMLSWLPGTFYDLPSSIGPVFVESCMWAACSSGRRPVHWHAPADMIYMGTLGCCA